MNDHYSRSSSLRKLNIGNNYFRPESLSRFLVAIGRKRFPLKSLQLSFSVFDKGEFKLIAQALKFNTQLEKLDLRGCNMCLDDLDLINGALKCSPCSLKTLNISINRIS